MMARPQPQRSVVSLPLSPAGGWGELGGLHFSPWLHWMQGYRSEHVKQHTAGQGRGAPEQVWSGLSELEAGVYRGVLTVHFRSPVEASCFGQESGLIM